MKKEQCTIPGQVKETRRNAESSGLNRATWAPGMVRDRSMGHAFIPFRIERHVGRGSIEFTLDSCNKWRDKGYL